MGISLRRCQRGQVQHKSRSRERVAAIQELAMACAYVTSGGRLIFCFVCHMLPSVRPLDNLTESKLVTKCQSLLLRHGRDLMEEKPDDFRTEETTAWKFVRIAPWATRGYPTKPGPRNEYFSDPPCWGQQTKEP